MTCVLSMNAIYNNPCGGFGGNAKDDAASVVSSAGDFDYNWISSAPPGGRLVTDTGTTTCSCRFDNHTTMCRTSSSSSLSLSSKSTEKSGLRKEDSTSISTKKIDARPLEMRVEERRTLGVKRKLDPVETDDLLDKIPPKRISPFLNTPKERKEERRKVLKISIQKLRQMEDPENFLCRSVLINNTLKKVQKEIREEKQKSYQGYKSCIYRMRPHCDYDVLNNSYLHSSPNGYVSMFEDQYLSSNDTEEKFTDEITDTLVRSLEENKNSISNMESVETSTVCSQGIHQHHDGCKAADDSERAESIPSIKEETHKEKQICSDMDVVFNNLIRALGET